MSGSRDYIIVYINGKRHCIKGDEIFYTLSDFLRDQKALTGTKVVCKEGDCGACNVLWYSPLAVNRFLSINSCISPIWSLDCSHIITIEGIKEDHELSEIQKSLANNYGSQCGFCTPGMVISLTELFNDPKKIKKGIKEKDIKNSLTGNLCRCTGYKGILESAKHVDQCQVKPIKERYLTKTILDDLKKTSKKSVIIETENGIFRSPTSIKDLVKEKLSGKLTIASSSTDLGVQLNKDHIALNKVITGTLIKDFYKLDINDDKICVGAKVSINTLYSSLKTIIPEFSDLLRVFASPQIKNVATLIGNVANASPIGDTLPFLSIMEATVVLYGKKGEREVPFNSFYKGYKKLNINKHEIILRIEIPRPKKEQFIKLYKVSKRKDLDISTITAGFLIELEDGNINDIKISYGGVAPTIIRLTKCENNLKGKKLEQQSFIDTFSFLDEEIAPIDDVRGSKDDRRLLAKNLFLKFHHELSKGIKVTKDKSNV